MIKQRIHKIGTATLCAAVLLSWQLPSFAQMKSRLQDPTAAAATERFEFHSDPWINLHHFLFQWAREDAVWEQADATYQCRSA